MLIISIFIFHWYLSLFFQTFFLHRYASHKMFTMHPVVERIFFLLTFLVQGSSFLQPAAYALMHRKHHTYSDTEQDPHSPNHSRNFISFMYKTYKEYRFYSIDILNGKYQELDFPRWEFIERIGDYYLTRFIFVIFYIWVYVAFSPSLWFLLLIPLHIMMGPIHGFIVNWFGHKSGYRNFDEIRDNSTNTLFLDVLMMGELYQNNHHKFPNNSNFAYRWFEFDFGYFITKILLNLRIISNRII